jgi:hypothetical protein
MPEYEGELEAFSETGTEGIVWSLLSNIPVNPQIGKETHSYYDRLVCLEPGDHIIIYDKDFAIDGYKFIVWEGDLDLEIESHKETNAFGFTGQAIFNMWCHGLQKTPFVEQWAIYFMKSYPAKIIRKEYENVTVAITEKYQ